MKKIYLLILTFFFAGLISYAQEDSLPKKIISFVPQNLIKRGIRVDYEFKIKERQWLQICPQFYLGDRNYKLDDYQYYSGSTMNNGLDNEDYNSIVGAGISIYHKYYPIQKHDLGWYISYGLHYNYFFTQFNVLTDYDQLIEEDHSIHKIGGDVLIGYQHIFFKVLAIDIYTGLGTRLSFFNPSIGNLHKFDNFFTSFGYTGNVMQLGLRIGVVL